MILKRVIYLLCGTIFGLLTLLILEGACFRLVENYASKRLSWSWGNYSQGSFHPILSKLPLDHFIAPPKAGQSEGSILEQYTQENTYSAKVMSFSLPLRDRYFEYLCNAADPLRKYHIRDLQSLRGVITPGLKRAAMLEDVRKGQAKRKGDLLEYAEGFFMVVTHAENNSDYEKQFAKLENSFAFLLENGFACVLVSSNNLEDLMGKISFLKASYPLLAENLIVYGKGEQASLVMEACFARPSFYRAILVENPTRAVPFPAESERTWFLAIQNAPLFEKVSTTKACLKWARKARQSEFLYPSRLGGLLRISKEAESLPIPSFAIAYALKCKSYFQVASMLYPSGKNSALDASQEVLGNVKTKTLDYPNFIFENEAVKIEKSFSKDFQTTNFECEMVTEYRKIHIGDPKVSKLSNRELVLIIGDTFASMGGGVLEEIAQKDPVFMRYYLSLRELNL